MPVFFTIGTRVVAASTCAASRRGTLAVRCSRDLGVLALLVDGGGADGGERDGDLRVRRERVGGEARAEREVEADDDRADDGFRRGFLADLASRRGRSGRFGEVDFAGRVDAVLDELAAHMAANLDLDAFAGIAGL